MRAFVLYRRTDVSGISGVGVVADGVQFPGGPTVLRWRGHWQSMVFYEQGLDAVREVHGHHGSTDLVFPEEMVHLGGLVALYCGECEWTHDVVPGTSVQGARDVAREHYLNGHLG